MNILIVYSGKYKMEYSLGLRIHSDILWGQV